MFPSHKQLACKVQAATAQILLPAMNEQSNPQVLLQEPPNTELLLPEAILQLPPLTTA
jgi:hypothetical protein